MINPKITITDIASGLNWKRNGLRSLLELVYKGTVKKIVVAYKDRLARFGFELLEWIFKQHETELVVLNQNSGTSDESELQQDLLSIVNVFVARHNGARSAINKRKRKEIEISEKSKETEN